MEQILEFISQYGLPVFVIASCSILLIGILKLCKVFNKISNKNIKKLIYYILNVVLSFGGVAIYYAAFKIGFNSYLIFCLTQISATTTLYAIYENFGVRKLVQIGLAWVTSWSKKNPESKFTKAAKALGFDEEKISAMIAEIKPAETAAPAVAPEVVPNTEQSTQQ